MKRDKRVVARLSFHLYVFLFVSLWLQRQSEHQVGFLAAGVADDFSEDGDAEGVGDLDVLRGAEGEVGHGEVLGSIDCFCAEWDGSCGGCPVACGELEGGAELEVGAVGALAVELVVVAGEVGVPLEGYGAEVIADVGLEDVVGAVGVVLEVASAGILSGAEPVVADADVEASDGVAEGEVELLGVGWFGEAYVAPGGEGESLPFDAERGLEACVAQFLATPDVLVDDVCADCGFNLLCLDGGGSEEHQSKN